jgi:DNA anti-recombination protein RmuC
MKIHNALTAEIGTRGQWGEGQIEVILNSLGFIEDTHYSIQPTLKPYADNPKGKKPDFVVFLPGGGAVAIDSKAITKSGFEAFYDSEEEKGNEKRQKFLQQHAVNIWSHLKALAERNYPLGLAQDLGVQGPDMTIMYVPNEQFLQRAYTGVSKQLKTNMGGDLTQAAIDKKVILAHPMTLATFLILIKQQWDASKVTDDVREYMQTASALVDEVIEVYEAWDEVGTHITNLSESYNEAVKKTESQDRRGSSIRTAIADFEALGATSAKKYSKGPKRGQKKSIEPLSEIRTAVDDAKGLTPMNHDEDNTEEEE